MSKSVTLIVIAKAPRPGRSKTRLCPPCTPRQAAWLAECALVDTLRAVAATPAARHVLALDGPPGRWLIPGVEVVPQGDGGLDERLATAFAAARTPALLVGMDTPQVSPELLRRAAAALLAAGPRGAVLGPALDGGYWAIGLPGPDAGVFRGVPMSEPTTGAAQRARLAERGYEVELLPRLRDVDTIADARAVAAAAPATRFAGALAGLESWAAA
jgi:rSAM/selenodomain-associated transferase 1